ncbi:uncharacterized protein CG5098 isoform X1 [Drosophila subobscura]|uniref:uncharacterized protein CG5098 isoform X1 n=2 Tax=Drosophila subobscura TaxID=7241 RepID=UPI00155AB7EB|nr:uncharacterized protein CG5098 isoform X1 [Drosophila subobscura]XP_034654806.1 uncharacterized protein CG5098 isoform X1 [Drosophila subobscura]
MANNNHPHGHLSQAAQNPSWNPLQIPSYIPRQPQLAHMSNERPMVRSPLAWHASVSAQPPPPPDALYNFMSANHKNLDHHHQMNPLLAPPYTGTLPFDSMDLSLQSARSAAQPLAKQPQQSQQQSQQQQQQQQSLMHAPNYPTISQNLASNATPTSAQLQQQQGHLAAMAAVMLQSSNQNAASSLVLSNGSDCESLLPRPPPTANQPPGSSSSNHTGSNNNVPSPHYMQNRDENFKLSQLKRSFEQEVLSSKSMQKDKQSPHNLQHQQQQTQQHANKKPSPLRNYHHQQQQQQQQQQQPPPYNLTPKYNGPQTPPTPQSPLAGPPHQMHSPTMDYNQLHLHHQLNSGSHGGGGYQHMQQEQPQHLHYHNQHVGGNQPVSVASPLHPPPPHLISSQFHAQQQSTAQPQHQQQQQQQQAPSTQQHTTHHSRSSQLTNLESMAKQKTQPEAENQTVITDLSYRNAAPSLPPAPAGEVEKPPVTDAPESPYLTTSNEESLESNSNSSNSRKRRKRKSSLVMRVTPNENAPEGAVAAKQQPQQQQQPGHTPSHHSNTCSPKQSPKIAGSDFQPFGMQSESQNDKTKQENGRGSSPTPTENSNSSTLYNDENPKTKKQRQALLQRNLTEQQRIQQEDEPPLKHTPPTLPPPSPQSNSSSSSSSSSSGNTHSSHSSHATSNDVRRPEKPENDENNATTDTPASPALVEQGNIDARPAVSVHECDEEEEPVGGATKEPESPQPAPVPALPLEVPETITAAAAAPPPTKETPPAANSEHCAFGEVEDKLEEMFAGIEEEPEQNGTPEKPAHPAGDDPVAHDLSAQLALDSAKVENEPAAAGTPASGSPATALPLVIPEVRPVATKAAKKSTLPSPVHSPTPETRSTSTPLTANEDVKSPSILTPPKGASSRRPPPRRLSMGMDASLLRFMIDEPTGKAKKAGGRGRKRSAPEPELDSEDDDKPSTSAAAAAALAVRQQNEVAAAKAAIPKATATKKKNAAGGKGKKGAAGKSKAKQNGKKSSAAGRKPPTTDEDSTQAPTNGGGGVDLRFKSPFILIKPDGSVSIKNTHSAEDVNEKQTKAKKAPHERKSLRGMHSSTLSNRYDADTTDSTWICVFCKRGPHKMGLGDLFGPYLVSNDCDEYRAALQTPGSQDFDGVFVSKRRREDMVQHRRNLPVVPATLAHIMQAPKISMHKRKRKHTHDSVYSCSDDLNESQSQSSQEPLDCGHETKFVETFRGMCKTSEHGYEVWLHEDCAVWTNDIQLIGAHVNGLDAAVWDSTRYQCVVCCQTGASVCCFERCCKATAHVPCARSSNWTLDEQERKVFCQMHGQSQSQSQSQTLLQPPPEVFKAEPVAAAPPATVPPPRFDVSSLP